MSAQQPEPPRKKTRGPTKCNDVMDIKDPSKRIQVRINIRGQPIGKPGHKLTSFFGAISRMGDLALIDVFDWREIPETKKDHIWGIVQSKFVFFPVSVETSTMKGWVLRDTGLKWKDWKGTLKSLFYDDTRDATTIIAEACKKRALDQTQFENLVKYWRTTDAKKTSETNTENRSKWDQPHNAGTKSFARLAAEMEEDLERAPEPWEIYVKTRSRENGTFTSERAKEVVGNIEQHVEKIRSQSAPFEEEAPISTDILTKAMDKPEQRGRERCMGLLPPSKERRKASSTPWQPLASLLQEHETLKSDYEELKNENVQLKMEQGRINTEMEKLTGLLKVVTEKIGM